jgi:poly-gamma-glutamate capsule biosynthesis protein CapA/YwtB (metallophosphatase superfamily)
MWNCVNGQESTFNSVGQAFLSDQNNYITDFCFQNSDFGSKFSNKVKLCKIFPIPNQNLGWRIKRWIPAFAGMTANLKVLLLILILLASLASSCSSQSLKICFTGDVLLDRGVRKHIEKSGIDSVLSGAKVIFSKADYTVINLECPAVEENTPLNKKYIFRAEPEWLNNLKKTGVTHCILANNHSYDQGREAVTETAYNITKAGMIQLGYGTNHTESCNPVIIEKDGIKCAVFSSVFLPLENWMFLPDKPSICQADAAELAERTRTFKSENPDCFIIVALHWGVEYRQFPHSGQVSQAETLIEAGADMIIGHHPHVVQSIQFIDNKPIFYSLGNFVFDQSKPLQNQAIAVIVELDKSREPEFRIYPVKINACAPSIMTTEDRDSFGKEIEKISYDIKLNNIGDYWLPVILEK